MDRRIRQRRAFVLRQMRRRRSLLVLGPTILAVVVGGGFALTESPLFAMSQVQLIGVPPSLAGPVKAKISKYLGQSGVYANPKTIEASVDTLGLVQSSSVGISLFGEVSVRVHQRIPIAQVPSGTGGFDEVDRYGVVTGIVAQRVPSLPVLCPSTPSSPTSCGAVGSRWGPGEVLPLPYREGLSIFSNLSKQQRISYPLGVVNGTLGTTVFDSRGNGCEIGASSRVSIKIRLCNQLIPTSVSWAHYLVDVSVPALPTESVLP